MTTTGRWIALEGGEASGKSTQARLLAVRLGALVTREPGGTVVGTRIREVLLDPAVERDPPGLDARAETLLMAADRAQHVSSVVRPALSSGRTVVSDRSAFSSLAYQGYGRGLDVDEVWRVCDWASAGLWPSLAVLLDVDDAVRSARLAAAGGSGDRMERAGEEFHRRVHEGFRALAAADPARWAVVDGAGPVDVVAGRVDAAVDEWIASHA